MSETKEEEPLLKRFATIQKYQSTLNLDTRTSNLVNAIGLDLISSKSTFDRPFTTENSGYCLVFDIQTDLQIQQYKNTKKSLKNAKINYIERHTSSYYILIAYLPTKLIDKHAQEHNINCLLNSKELNTIQNIFDLKVDTNRINKTKEITLYFPFRQYLVTKYPNIYCTYNIKSVCIYLYIYLLF